MKLTEFLLARIAEDEAAARDAGEQQRTSYYWGGDTSDKAWREGAEGGFGGEAGVLAGRYSPTRVLAECEAKRRIVALSQVQGTAQFPDYDGGYDSGWEDVSSDAVSCLAQPYADHPDFDPDWNLA